MHLSQRVPFVKMQSVGNDIIIIPRDIKLNKRQVQSICHRRYGLGCDQLMILSSPMAIWNNDGSYAEACGNGTRCVIAYLTQDIEKPLPLHGPCGPLLGWREANGQITVQQGHGRLYVISQAHQTLLIPSIPLADLPHNIPVDVGNPHLVIFSGIPAYFDAEWIDFHLSPYFPEGVNVSFVTSWSPRIEVSTWERGVGWTEGCGTAACAVACVLASCKQYVWPISMRMKGGDISVNQTATGMLQHTAFVTMIAEGNLYLTNHLTNYNDENLV